MPPSCASTSTALVQKGGSRQTGPREQPRRPERQDKCHGRCVGNLTGFLLTPGQAHDLKGADVLLKDTPAQTVIADKAYDAQARLIEPLLDNGKAVVIPSRVTNKQPREYDRDLYKARHLIENFFARLKQYRAIATRYDKTARNFLGAIHLVASMVWLA